MFPVEIHYLKKIAISFSYFKNSSSELSRLQTPSSMKKDNGEDKGVDLNKPLNRCNSCRCTISEPKLSTLGEFAQFQFNFVNLLQLHT